MLKSRSLTRAVLLQLSRKARTGGATPLLRPENDTARAGTSATERIRAGFSEPPLCPPTPGGGGGRKPARAAPRSFRLPPFRSVAPWVRLSRCAGAHAVPTEAV